MADQPLTPNPESPETSENENMEPIAPQPTQIPSDPRLQKLNAIEAVLKRQIITITERAKEAHTAGDVNAAKKLLAIKKMWTGDIQQIQIARLSESVRPPSCHTKELETQVEVTNSDLRPDGLEFSIVDIQNLDVPEGYSALNLYAIVKFPFPESAKQTFRSEKALCPAPLFVPTNLKWSYVFKIDRKKCAALKTKKISVQLWHYRGFFFDLDFGRAEIKFQEILDKSTAAFEVPIVDPVTLKNTGGTLSIKLRVQTPLIQKERMTIGKDKFLFITQHFTLDDLASDEPPAPAPRSHATKPTQGNPKASMKPTKKAPSTTNPKQALGKPTATKPNQTSLAKPVAAKPKTTPAPKSPSAPMPTAAPTSPPAPIPTVEPTPTTPKQKSEEMELEDELAELEKQESGETQDLENHDDTENLELELPEEEPNQQPEPEEDKLPNTEQPTWSPSLKVMDYRLAKLNSQAQPATEPEKQLLKNKIMTVTVVMNELIRNCQAGNITIEAYYSQLEKYIDNEKKAIITFQNHNMPQKVNECQKRISLMEEELAEGRQS